jgi:DNA-binding response OmpR family regulator
MDPIVCFPSPTPAEILLSISEIGYSYHCVSSAIDAENDEARVCVDGWSGAVVLGTENLSDALSVCRTLRKREQPIGPLILIVTAEQLEALSLREELFDDFLCAPFDVKELSTRLSLEFERRGQGINADTVSYGPLEINLSTYQAAVKGRILDLTFMEYELLRFLATHPLKVFTRETLLSRVWGYEYYGGARTVDVHIRRLRAKLGEENAYLIQTVRSVGYRFGQNGWTPESGPSDR